MSEKRKLDISRHDWFTTAINPKVLSIDEKLYSYSTVRLDIYNPKTKVPAKLQRAELLLVSFSLFSSVCLSLIIETEILYTIRTSLSAIQQRELLAMGSQLGDNSTLSFWTSHNFDNWGFILHYQVFFTFPLSIISCQFNSAASLFMVYYVFPIKSRNCSLASYDFGLSRSVMDNYSAFLFLNILIGFYF